MTAPATRSYLVTLYDRNGKLCDPMLAESESAAALAEHFARRWNPRTRVERSAGGDRWSEFSILVGEEHAGYVAVEEVQS